MKKIFFLIAFICLSAISFCQVIDLDPTNSATVNIDTSEIVMMADSGIVYPTVYDLQQEINTINELIEPFLDSVELETVVTMQDDTNAFVAVFGLGSGQTVDTSLFNDNALIGSVDITGSDSINVKILNCRIRAGTGTETVTVNICWDEDTLMAVVPVKLNTSGYTVTNLNVSNEDLSFNNSIIPPGSVLYGYISGISAGNRPSYLGCTLSGQKQNRSY